GRRRSGGLEGRDGERSGTGEAGAAVGMIMLNLISPTLAFLFQEAPRTPIEQMKDSATHPDLSKFLVIGALLFIIGVAGVLTRRNIIVIFMSIELILNAANLNFI